MVQRFIGLLMFLGAMVGAYFCIINARWQDDAIRRFAPVKAILVKAEIAEHRGSKGGTNYSPRATFTYSYQGKEYTSTRVRPIGGIQAGRAWAQSVLNKIERAPEGGPQVTAYVNPRQPDEAFLVRDYSFSVYGGGMGTLFGAALGLGMLLGIVGTARTKMTAVALDDSGWQLLLPQMQMRKQYWRSLYWLVGAVVALLGWPIHWYVIAGQGGTAALIATSVALVVLATLATIAYRRWSVSHHLSDARLRLRPAPMLRGACLALDVGIDAQAPLRVTSMTAKVVCIEHYKERHGNKTNFGTRTHAEKTVPLSGPATVKAGEEITGKGEVTFEAYLPPTTELTIKNYPYYTWEIRLALVLEGAVDYAAVFPLEVD